ncbi:MAG: hypothetical protein L0H29_00035 [Sinobacteraceae bacterium]|nr:hypothetical protein [Nevskiaceae bacterium]
MLTYAITVSVSFDDSVPQDVDVRVSTNEVDAALDTIQQDVDVHVCTAGGARDKVVAIPAPRHESASVSSAAPQREDDYVLGGYAGI